MTLACNISEKITGSLYGRLQCGTGHVMKVRGHSQTGWALFIEKKREYSFWISSTWVSWNSLWQSLSNKQFCGFLFILGLCSDSSLWWLIWVVNLVWLGKWNLSWGTASMGLACGYVCGECSWFVIDGRKPSPSQALLFIGSWSWVLKEGKVGKTEEESQ